MIDFPNNPILGQVALSGDGTVWTWNGIAWVFQSTVTGNRGSVSGMVAYAQVVANQGPITTEVNIVGLAVSPVLTAGRVYRVTAQIHHVVSISGDRVIMQIKDGGTGLNSAEAAISTAPNGNLYTEAIINATAGVHNFTVTMWRATGTGTTTLIASPAMPAFIMVEDITFETVVAATAASGGGGSGFTFVTDITPTPTKQGDTWFNTAVGAGGGRSCVAVNEEPGNLNSELVWVQYAPGNVAGADLTTQMMINEQFVRGVGTGGTVLAATWADIPSTPLLSVNITKLRSDSLLVVSLDVSFYTNGVAGQQFGVGITGQGDNVVIASFCNQVSEHTGRSGTRAFTGIPAGTYQVLGRCASNGVSTINADANDQFSLSVREVRRT